MRKRVERADISVFLVRHDDGRYLASPDVSRFYTEQGRAHRFKTREAARASATRVGAKVIRLIVRLSEEEG